jgi:(p)ppGpp synthase/HD superfamily hydrolase
MKAREFAKVAHGEQKYGSLPYIVHLDTVASLAEEVGRPELIEAAYLHDVLEDTSVTREAVAEVFGEEVARLVVAVTDEAGKTRKERHLVTYPKVREAGEAAVMLKLLDRLANVSSPHPSLLAMYRSEHEVFREALFRPGHEVMWSRIEAALA